MNKVKTNLQVRPVQAGLSDPGLPHLTMMFDLTEVGRLIGSRLKDKGLALTSLKVTYVRYKPSTSCVIGYEVLFSRDESESDEPLHMYAKLYRSREFPSALAKLAQLESLDVVQPFGCEEYETIFYPISCDKELPGIDLALTPRKLVRPLREGLDEYPSSLYRISDKRLTSEVIRYKPERRAVVRLTTRAKDKISGKKNTVELYARFYSDGRADQIAPLMKQLALAGRDAVPPVLIPTPVSVIHKKNLLVTRAIPGRPLSEILENDAMVQSVEKAGEMLRWLHGIDGSTLNRYRRSDLIYDMKATTETLKSILPRQTDLVVATEKRLLERLDQTPEAEHGLIHGDFYPEQVLVSEVDQSMGLIDFDRAMLGEQMLDVANFCAWLQFNRHGHSMDATSVHEGVFTGAYFNGQPKSDVRHILDSLVLVQMYRLVVMPFRRWEQDWGNRVFSRLQAVKGKLE